MASSGLSVPFRPRVAPTADERDATDGRGAVLQALLSGAGVAEAEFERDPRHTIRICCVPCRSMRRRNRSTARQTRVPAWSRATADSSPKWRDPDLLPAWLTEADVDFYANEFARTGFRSGLNWYRNIDRNWELMAPFAGLKVTVPALYIAGDRDSVVGLEGRERIDRSAEVRPEPAQDDHAARLRALDAAGARRRGQRGAARVPARPVARALVLNPRSGRLDPSDRRRNLRANPRRQTTEESPMDFRDLGQSQPR